MDDRLDESLMPGYLKRYDIFIQNSTATLNNDYFRVSDAFKLQFYQVNQIEKYTRLTTGD